jgi:hypothetical protein
MLSLLPFNYGFSSAPAEYTADGKLIVYTKEQLESVLVPAETTESRTGRPGGYIMAQLQNDLVNANNLDVSRVTDFSMLFASPAFKDKTFDVSDWDVSGGTSFRMMFEGTTMFNGDLSSWDVSEGRDFRRMFRSATAFDGDVTMWDVSKATKMHSMFRDAKAFHGCNRGCVHMNGWDVSKVVEFNSMFLGATMFKGRLSGWKVSNANTRYMFANASSFDAEKKGLFGPDCRTEWDLSACIKARRNPNSDCVNVDGMFAGANLHAVTKGCLQGILSAEQLVKAQVA